MKIYSLMAACVATLSLVAKAEISYEVSFYGPTLTTDGTETVSNILTFLETKSVSLDDVTVMLGSEEKGPAHIIMDDELDVGFVSMVTGCTLTYNNTYGKTPLIVTDNSEDWPTYLQGLAINFAPTTAWENHYECQLLGSDTGNSGYQIWGTPANPKEDLQTYLSNFHFTLGGLAEGLQLASSTGFVASREDVKEGQVGILLDGFEIYDTSVMLRGLTLVANVSSKEAPVVPEPSTGTLSLLALAGLCARRRRK